MAYFPKFNITLIHETYNKDNTKPIKKL